MPVEDPIDIVKEFSVTVKILSKFTAFCGSVLRNTDSEQASLAISHALLDTLTKLPVKSRLFIECLEKIQTKNVKEGITEAGGPGPGTAPLLRVLATKYGVETAL